VLQQLFESGKTIEEVSSILALLSAEIVVVGNSAVGYQKYNDSDRALLT
jgi:hypothetical protein